MQGYSAFDMTERKANVMWRVLTANTGLSACAVLPLLTPPLVPLYVHYITYNLCLNLKINNNFVCDFQIKGISKAKNEIVCDYSLSAKLEWQYKIIVLVSPVTNCIIIN